jgi:hypothetical protein
MYIARNKAKLRVREEKARLNTKPLPPETRIAAIEAKQPYMLIKPKLLTPGMLPALALAPPSCILSLSIPIKAPPRVAVNNLKANSAYSKLLSTKTTTLQAERPQYPWELC